MFLLKNPTEQDFEKALKDARLEQFFHYNPEAEFTILSGYKMTRLESEAKKGDRYGFEEKPNRSLYPVGSLGHALASTQTVINRNLTYTVTYDFETYELSLSKTGLSQKITHFYRTGTRLNTPLGPSFARGLDACITDGDFMENEKLTGQFHYAAEYSFTKPLTATFNDILWYSGLTPRKLIKLIQKTASLCQNREIRSRKTKTFRTLGVLGIKDKGDGLHKRYTYGEYENLPIKDGKVIEKSKNLWPRGGFCSSK